MIDPTRAIGILYIGSGMVLRGDAASDDRTSLVVGPDDIEIGGIVRDPASDRWHYDAELLRWLQFDSHRDFATDRDAARRLREILDVYSGSDS